MALIIKKDRVENRIDEITTVKYRNQNTLEVRVKKNGSTNTIWKYKDDPRSFSAGIMCTIAPENPIEFYQYRVTDAEGVLGTIGNEYDCIHFVTKDDTFRISNGDTSVTYPFSYNASKTRLATVVGFNYSSSIEIPVAVQSYGGISYRSQLISLHSDDNNYRAIPEYNTSNVWGRIIPKAITNITGNYGFTLFMEVTTDVYNYLNIKLYTPVWNQGTGDRFFPWGPNGDWSDDNVLLTLNVDGRHYKKY